MIRVQVNGEPRELPAPTTVAGLLIDLGAHPEGVAVALNGEVVPRGLRGERMLDDGDRVEIIRAVGGG